MTNRREFAREQAQAFTAKMMSEFEKTLTHHSADVVEFACEMQARLDAAELLVRRIADLDRPAPLGLKKPAHHVKVPVEIMERIDALVAEMKVRTP